MSIQAGDARYSTRNTNLAACIGSLKVPVKSEQPITVVKNEDGTKTVSFWFENEGAEEFCGVIHKPLELELCWKHREQFERENPNHPLVAMRSALDKRDWLTKAWHGRIMPAASLDKAGFSTGDIFLASVLMASGYPLLRLEKPNYIFRKIKKTELDRIKDDFDNFETPGFIERTVAVMRRALEARAILVKLARHPDIEAQIKLTDGIVDRDGGRIAFVSEKASDETFSKTIDALQSI